MNPQEDYVQDYWWAYRMLLSNYQMAEEEYNFS